MSLLSSSASPQPPKRSEWRLISKTYRVFDYETIKLCVEVIFVKHKPIFITANEDRKEIRLSLLGYLRKNFLEELLTKYNASDYIEIKGVMNNEKLVSDEEAYQYWLKKWPFDKQPEGYEDVNLNEDEKKRIMKVLQEKGPGPSAKRFLFADDSKDVTSRPNTPSIEEEEEINSEPESSRRTINVYQEVNDSGIVTLNCIIAKQVCIDDPLCGPTLDIVDRVCGSEVVSCSTVTVTKCQAALKTLQTFPFFNPTCLCREPQLDQKCNSFRTFLFDHPCLFANRREKDPYPIDSLVSCTHAHSICKSDSNCSRIYDHFKNVCKTNEDDKCIPELQESCKEAWAKIRLTPMFGCICPPNLWQGQKKCDRHFNFVNHNRCAGTDLPIETNDILTNFQSTCFQAMEMCQKNVKCASAISAIIAYCTNGECKREKCRHSLQSLYRNKSLVKYAVEIAFCLCKKTNNSEEDACMQAQNTLHPSCAQEVDTITQPTCHSVAEGCRADHECGPLLEEFEQLCATDNYTKTCAGYPEQCRIGMLGILGTKLRTNCVCKGTDRAKLYECVGWQRVLWFNPCVVEAQREFHMNKVRVSMSIHKHSSSISVTRSTYESLMTTPLRTTSMIVITSTTTTTQPSTTTTTTTTTTKPATRTVRTTRLTTPSTTTTTLSTQATLPSTTSVQPTSKTTQPNTQIFRKHSSNNGLLNVISRGREKSPMHTTQAPLNGYLTPEDGRRVTTSSTSTKPNYFANSRYRAKPKVPPQGCILQKTSLDEEMFVAEGKATRFYHDFENDCSELCYCAPGSILRCQTECIQPHPCKNEKAVYKHGAPSYQAFRGRCLCYSGHFICMRPKLGTYTTPPGVFLFLGYSSKDEQLMSKHVSFDIQTSVQELQELISKTSAPEASCGLSLFGVAEENAIVIAKHKNQSWDSTEQTNMNPTMDEVAQDKVSCYSSLEKIAKAVNEQNPNIKTNVFLSVFKLAEIDIIYPETSNSNTIQSNLFLSYLSIFIILING